MIIFCLVLPLSFWQPVFRNNNFRFRFLRQILQKKSFWSILLAKVVKIYHKYFGNSDGKKKRKIVPRLVIGAAKKQHFQIIPVLNKQYLIK